MSKDLDNLGKLTSLYGVELSKAIREDIERRKTYSDFCYRYHVELLSCGKTKKIPARYKKDCLIYEGINYHYPNA